MDSRNSYVIAGDIGGTKVLLELAVVSSEGVHVLHKRLFKSADYGDFAVLVRTFLQDLPADRKPSAACFGVAGPVISSDAGQQAALTNLPWHIATREIAGMTGIDKVGLINDWGATGYGIEALRPDDLVVLQAGTPQPQGVRALIGAGTGLGEAILCWCQDHYEVISTEGGHVDFAPIDKLQVELWHYLTERLGRISYERLLSGAGLVRIYSFLRERGDAPETPALANAVAEGDAAAAISRAAMSGGDELAQKALDLFVSIYGAQAGNLALTTLAHGGVYIAGGVAAKIIDKMRDGTFMRAFRTKGRMSLLLETIPVYVATNQEVGLMGAALAASRM